MNYISLYRKYRPKNFDEIVGQNEIKKALKNSIINNMFSHAYLFSGPQGIGKTSIAKIFSNLINCINLNNGNLCNNCLICTEINNTGKLVDIFEIDASLNDDFNKIKEIKKNINTFPIIAKYKIFIINKAHMLTNLDFNLLLKIIEEPPQYIIFILLTTKICKIPITIVYHCQHYNFHKISKIELEKNIINILQKEKINNYDLNAVKEIAFLSNGSVCNSLNILEQIIIFSNRNITIENVNIIFTTVSKTIELELLKNILEYKTTEVLFISKKIYELGFDLEILISNLLDILKEIFEFKQTNNLFFLNFLLGKQAKEFIKQLNSKELFFLIDLFINSLNLISNIKIQETYFELILLKALSIFKNNIKDLKNLELNDSNNLKYDKKNNEIINSKEIKFSKNELLSNISFSLDEKKQNINYNNKMKLQQKQKKIDFDKNIKFNLSEIKKEENSKLIKLEQIFYEKEIEKINDLQNYFNNTKNKINIHEFPDINHSNILIFNILIEANKEKREKFKNKFIELINEKEKKIQLEKLISFYNVKYVAASEKGLICITDTKSQANWISFEICNSEFRDKIFKLFNFKFIIIALSENEWINIRSDYFNLKQANKLPEIISINIEDFYYNLLTKQINDYEKHKEIIENGKKIFDIIKIIK